MTKNIHIGCVIPSTLNTSVLLVLKNAVESVLKASKLARIKTTIIIVTTNSTIEKKSITNIVKRETKILTVEKDTGFGEMNNAAIKNLLSKSSHDRIDHLMLLNDDAWIEKDFFVEYLKSIKKIKSEVTIPLIYSGNQSHRIDSFGMEIFRSGYAHDSVNLKTRTQWGTAACLLFNAKFVEKIIEKFGFFFNPQIHFYYEDVELAFRCFSENPKISKCKAMVAHHLRSFSSGKKSDFTLFNTLQSYLWITLMSWPKKSVSRYGVSFLTIYFWLLINTAIKGRFTILYEIASNYKKNHASIWRMRKKINAAYGNNYHLHKFLSPYLFRTRKKEILIK